MDVGYRTLGFPKLPWARTRKAIAHDLLVGRGVLPTLTTPPIILPALFDNDPCDGCRCPGSGLAPGQLHGSFPLAILIFFRPNLS